MPRAFISYARTDAEFALRMASDLREMGVPVWLDQLDIPPGDPWDEAVEDALEDASHFLLVMTPASVSSSNVRDELAYAIDEGMRIIPILLADCKVPLRVRRIQWTDFREGYEEPLEELAKALPRDWRAIAPEADLAAAAPAPQPADELMLEKATGAAPRRKAADEEEAKEAESAPAVWINFADEDADFVGQLTTNLEQQGFATWATPSNQAWGYRLWASIGAAPAMLVAISPDALQCEGVLATLQYAEALNRRIVPVIVRPISDPPAWFTLRYGNQKLLDFSSGSYEENIAALAEQLRALT